MHSQSIGSRGKKGAAKHRVKPLTEYAEEFLRSVWFDIGIGIVIGLNAISIGVEQQLELDGRDLTAIQIVESAFLCIYIMEVILRVFAHGLAAFRDNWVKFDLFMVFIGVVSQWIIGPLFQGESDEVGFVMVLRTARLLRLTRTARLFAKVEELWALVRAFMGSFRVMAYSFCILFMLMYVFGAVGVELITKHPLASGPDEDIEFKDQVAIYFPNLPMAMLSLVHFACLDNMSDIWLPLVSRDWALALYFVAVVLIMGIIVMGIIASVIHMSTQEQNTQEQEIVKKEQEHKQAALISELKKVFIRIDADGSGCLSYDEVMNITKDDQEYLSRALRVHSCRDLYKALDVEGNGKVTINDFFDGLWDATALQKDLKMQRMEKQVEMMHWRIKETLDSQMELCRKVDKVFSTVETLSITYQRDALDRRSECSSLPETPTSPTPPSPLEAGRGPRAKRGRAPRAASDGARSEDLATFALRQGSARRSSRMQTG